METINNVASAAAKVVWGDTDSNKEPVSGVKGDVSKGEPYDAGNLADPDEQEKLAAKLAAAPPTPATEAFPKPTSPTAPVAPAVANEGPSDGQTKLDDPADEDPDKQTIPEDQLKGPGPKPVEIVAREHGGDAGHTADIAPGSVAAQKSEEEKQDAELTPATQKGLGTEHVKSTGLKADGGDFDATKPGAGIEADRLMGTKGIAHGDSSPAPAADPSRSSEQSSKPSTDASSTASPSTASKKKRMSLGARIKAKLHKN